MTTFITKESNSILWYLKSNRAEYGKLVKKEILISRSL